MPPTSVLMVHNEAYEAITEQNFFWRLFLTLPFHRSVAIAVSKLCNALCIALSVRHPAATRFKTLHLAIYPELFIANKQTNKKNQLERKCNVISSQSHGTEQAVNQLTEDGRAVHLCLPWSSARNRNRGRTAGKEHLSTIEMEEEYIQSLVTGTLHRATKQPTQWSCVRPSEIDWRSHYAFTTLNSQHMRSPRLLPVYRSR